MKLELSKSLALFDLETTGLDIVNDRIVEISILLIQTDGSQTTFTERINPTIPISPESIAIHGISDEDVRDKPTFKEIGHKIKQFIGSSDLGGFNSNRFDIPLLVQEFLQNDIEFDISKRKLIDVQNIFHKMEKRTLQAAYKFYCNKELIDAHSAESDVKATFDVLEAQLEKYGDLTPTSTFLHEFSAMNKNVDLAGRMIYDEGGTELFNFGKYKGKSVSSVLKKDASYYSWIMNADFPLETKQRLTSIKLKEKSQES